MKKKFIQLLTNLRDRWMRFAALVGHFNAQVILSLIYFFLLTPLACLFRLFGQDPLSLRRHKRGSYWTRRSTVTDILLFLKKMY